MEKYMLTETELHALLQDHKRLEALEAYGVDNWFGYEDAMNDEEYEITDEDLAEYPRIGIADVDSVNINAGKSTGVENE